MSYLINLFLLDSDPSLLLFGTYNPWLVVLSLVVAIFTSGMALQLSGISPLHLLSVLFFTTHLQNFKMVPAHGFELWTY